MSPAEKDHCVRRKCLANQLHFESRTTCCCIHSISLTWAALESCFHAVSKIKVIIVINILDPDIADIGLSPPSPSVSLHTSKLCMRNWVKLMSSGPSHHPLACSLQKRRGNPGRPGPFYHVNDVVSTLVTSRGRSPRSHFVRAFFVLN